MKLLDQIRALLAPEAAPTVDTLERTVTELTQAHDAAKRAHAEAEAEHVRRALEWVTDEAAGAKSAQAVGKLRAHADTLGQALDSARDRLQAAKVQRAAQAADRAWQDADAKLLAHVAAARRVQAAADALAQAHADLMTATEEAWQALPQRPPYRPVAFTAGGLNASLQTYLFGASEGRLGTGTNVQFCRTRPDLVHRAQEAVELLTMPRQTTATQEAAA